jgi:hypothetical protein
MVRDAFQAVGADGGAAAKMGAQHQHVAAAQTNQGSLGQAAYAKAMRKGTGADGKGPSLAMQMYEAGNKSLDLGRDAQTARQISGALNGAHQVAGMVRGSYNNAAGVTQADTKFAVEGVSGAAGAAGAAVGSRGASGGSALGQTVANGVGNYRSADLAAGNMKLGWAENQRGVTAVGAGQNLGWQGSAADLKGGGMRDYASKLGSSAEFEAQSAAWEAKNAFASHASAMGGIAGMNTGALAPGPKPQDMNGMAMAGMLDRHTATGNKTATGWSATSVSSNVGAAVSYSGGKESDGFQATTDNWSQAGQSTYGSEFVMQPWTENGGAYKAEYGSLPHTLTGPGKDNPNSHYWDPHHSSAPSIQYPEPSKRGGSVPPPPGAALLEEGAKTVLGARDAMFKTGK